MAHSKSRSESQDPPLGEWDNDKLFTTYSQMLIIAEQLRKELDDIHQRSNQANLVLKVIRDARLARLCTDQSTSLAKEISAQCSPLMKDVPEEFFAALPQFLPEDFPPNLLPLSSRSNNSSKKSVRFSDVVKTNLPRSTKPSQTTEPPFCKQKSPIPALMDLKIPRPPNWYQETYLTNLESSHSPLPAFKPSLKNSNPSGVQISTSQLTPEAPEFHPRGSIPTAMQDADPELDALLAANPCFTLEDIQIWKYLGLDKLDFYAPPF